MTTPTVQKPSAAAPMALPQNQKATNQTIKPAAQPYTPEVTKPSNDAMVENRIGGLLDPNNPLMKKAVAQSQQFAAKRGLQSSSIANESALSSMIDKAQGIASQDANTIAQFERDNAGRTHESGMQSNQQSWQSGENALGRDHDMSVIDKNNTNQTGLLQMQQQFQSGENALSRDFQQKMQDLQYQQQLGVLDVQGKQQLQQMERNAQLTTERDSILQKYQKELNTQQNQQQLSVLDKELNARKDLLKTELDAKTYSEYNNAISNGYNNMLAQMGAIYSNPEMTPQQQAAGVAKITEMFKSQQAQLETLYGLKVPVSSAPPATGVKPPVAPLPGPAPTPTNPVKTTQPVQPPRTISPPQSGKPMNIGAPVGVRYMER